jgi:hypothetical protein
VAAAAKTEVSVDFVLTSIDEKASSNFYLQKSIAHCQSFVVAGELGSRPTTMGDFTQCMAQSVASPPKATEYDRKETEEFLREKAEMHGGILKRYLRGQMTISPTVAQHYIEKECEKLSPQNGLAPRMRVARTSLPTMTASGTIISMGVTTPLTDVEKEEDCLFRAQEYKKFHGLANNKRDLERDFDRYKDYVLGDVMDLDPSDGISFESNGDIQGIVTSLRPDLMDYPAPGRRYRDESDIPSQAALEDNTEVHDSFLRCPDIDALPTGHQYGACLAQSIGSPYQSVARILNNQTGSREMLFCNTLALNGITEFYKNYIMMFGSSPVLADIERLNDDCICPEEERESRGCGWYTDVFNDLDGLPTEDAHTQFQKNYHSYPSAHLKRALLQALKTPKKALLDNTQPKITEKNYEHRLGFPLANTPYKHLSTWSLKDIVDKASEIEDFKVSTLGRACRLDNWSASTAGDVVAGVTGAAASAGAWLVSDSVDEDETDEEREVRELAERQTQESISSASTAVGEGMATSWRLKYGYCPIPHTEMERMSKYYTELQGAIALRENVFPEYNAQVDYMAEGEKVMKSKEFSAGEGREFLNSVSEKLGEQIAGAGMNPHEWVGYDSDLFDERVKGPLSEIFNEPAVQKIYAEGIAGYPSIQEEAEKKKQKWTQIIAGMCSARNPWDPCYKQKPNATMSCDRNKAKGKISCLTAGKMTGLVKATVKHGNHYFDGMEECMASAVGLKGMATGMGMGAAALGCLAIGVGGVALAVPTGGVSFMGAMGIGGAMCAPLLYYDYTEKAKAGTDLAFVRACVQAGSCSAEDLTTEGSAYNSARFWFQFAAVAEIGGAAVDIIGAGIDVAKVMRHFPKAMRTVRAQSAVAGALPSLRGVKTSEVTKAWDALVLAREMEAIKNGTHLRHISDEDLEKNFIEFLQTMQRANPGNPEMATGLLNDQYFKSMMSVIGKIDLNDLPADEALRVRYLAEAFNLSPDAAKSLGKNLDLFMGDLADPIGFQKLMALATKADPQAADLTKLDEFFDPDAIARAIETDPLLAGKSVDEVFAERTVAMFIRGQNGDLASPKYWDHVYELISTPGKSRRAYDEIVTACKGG